MDDAIALALCSCSKEEFYSLLKDVQAPDTLALYDHRLPPSKLEELKV